jgi:two-component system LytT family response regulator
MTMRALIVDDERIARDGVRTLLESEPDVEIVGECEDGGSAVSAIEREQPDLVLLDIQMPAKDGFEVIREIGEERLPVIVFLTAYDQHAIRAFDAHALDYLVKPFTDDRFRKAIARAREQVHQRRIGAATSRLASVIAELVSETWKSASPPRRRYLARIPIRSVGKTAYVSVDDLLWIGAADYYAELHTRDGRKHLLRETMRNLEERLDPNQFVRVHRSAIVNTGAVAEIRTDAERHFAVLRDGTKLSIGPSRLAMLEAALSLR